ncbi:DUF3253 domain-containing protein [Cognataquiflexum rubidum]|uniref:DUF3253 domain-containing protein n=1 Tax=Cognataquiflexum rubidum TaxID=2922273 RepID=UPI001F139B31|nr:DUF3253 domain-containing protein [Cognataquiflexum rubidum]MCH6233046.1 DUF3253 domain-containing protein [Cognataquiflexum rubidum]
MSISIPSDHPHILADAIMEMCRVKKGESFCPSEVVKWIYPESWYHFMEEVTTEMMKLYQSGKIEVTQNHLPIPMEGIPKGEVRIKAKF